MRGLGCCVLVGLSACRATPPAEPSTDHTTEVTMPDEPVRADPKGYVVVPHTAVFYRNAAGDPIATRSYLDGADDGTLGGSAPGWVMRVTGSTADVVSVEPMVGDDPAGACGVGFEGLEAMALHLYVRRSALTPATTREVTVAFPDGTRATVPPAVPVREADGELRADAWGLSVGPIPKDAVGTYVPALLRYERGAPTGTLEAGVFPTFDGGRAVDDAVLHRAENGAVATYGVEVDLTRVQGPCLRAETKLLPDDRLGTIGGLGGGGYGGSSHARRAVHRLQTGDELFWSDGGIAGSIREPVQLAGIYQSTETGHRCHWQSVGDGSRDIQLCVDPDAIEVLPFARFGVRQFSATPSPNTGPIGDFSLRYLLHGTEATCFADALADEPQGSLHMSVVVSEARRVTEVVVSDVTFRAPGVARCVREQALGRWSKAGRFEGTIVVEAPKDPKRR